MRGLFEKRHEDKAESYHESQDQPHDQSQDRRPWQVSYQPPQRPCH